MKRKLWIVLLTAVLTVTALAGFAITANATGSGLTWDLTQITLDASNNYTYEVIDANGKGSYTWSKNPTTGEYTLKLPGYVGTESWVFPTDGKVTILVSGSCSIESLSFVGENRANVEIKKDPSSAAAVNTLTLGAFYGTGNGDTLTIADGANVKIESGLFLGASGGMNSTLTLGKNASLWVTGDVTLQQNLTLGESSTLTVETGTLSFHGTPSISLDSDAKINISPLEGQPALYKEGTDTSAFANLPLPTGDGYSYGVVDGEYNAYLLHNGQKVTGAVTLTQGHVHHWTYIALVNVITATCTCGTSQTLTLNVPATMYEGNIQTPTLTSNTADGSFGEYSASVISGLSFVYCDMSSGEPVTTPTNPGLYCVMVTLRTNITAMADFTIVEHTHSWTYTGANNVLTATCTCGLTHTLTLTMPSEIDEVDVTSATKATITLSTTDGWFGDYIRSTLENRIQYVVRGGTDGTLEPSATPGNYTVKLALDDHDGGAAASVNYTVTEHTHIWWTSASDVENNVFTVHCSKTTCPKHTDTRVVLTFPYSVQDNNLSAAVPTWTIGGQSATDELWASIGFSGAPTLSYCAYVTGELSRDMQTGYSTTLPTAVGQYWVLCPIGDWTTSLFQEYVSVSFRIEEHTHDWTYAWKNDGSYAVVTATCTAMENCYKNAELQMIAPACTEEYGDGDMRARIQVTPSGLTTFGGFSISYLESFISYKTATGADLGSAAPTAAGTYKAYVSVIVGTTTYMPGVTYTVTPHTCTWTYRQDEDLLIAECTKKSKGCTNAAYVMLMDPDLTFEGQSGKSADVIIEISGSGNNSKFGDYTEADLRGMITYYKLNIDEYGNSENIGSTAPTTSGENRARLACRNAGTMEIEYYIGAHTHDWTYSFPAGGNGSVATATCSYESCSYHTNPATLTLTAPAHKMVYDGLIAVAELTDSVGVFSIGNYVFTYYSAQNLTTPLTNAPYNTAGSYVVVATDRNDTSKSLMLTYSIAEHQHDWDYSQMAISPSLLKAECTYSACGAVAELVLEPPTLTQEYGSGSAEATVAISSATDTFGGYSQTELQGMIDYWRDGHTSLGNTAPTTAGSYSAMLQVGDIVLYTDYTISAHTHSWSYDFPSTSNSNTLTATCQSTNCPKHTTPVTVQILAPSREYKCTQIASDYSNAIVRFVWSDSSYDFAAIGIDFGGVTLTNDSGTASCTKNNFGWVVEDAGDITIIYFVGGAQYNVELSYDLKAHELDFGSATVDNVNHTATIHCKNASCPRGSVTLKLIPPTCRMRYDGGSCNAAYEVWVGSTKANLADADDVESLKDDFGIDAVDLLLVYDGVVTIAPTMAGSHTVELYYGGDSLMSLTYTIAAHQHDYIIIGALQNVAPIYCACEICPNWDNPILTVTLNAPEHKEVHDGKNPAVTWSGFPEGKSWSDYGFSEVTFGYDNLTTDTGYTDPQDTKDVVGEYVIWAQIDRVCTLTVTNTIAAHTHSWNYTPVVTSAGFDTLYATCTSANCEYGTNGTPVVLTLNAPTKTYTCSEGSNAATVTWNQTGDVNYSFIGFSQATLEYSEDQNTWSTSAPNTAGTHYVRLVLTCELGTDAMGGISYTLGAHNPHWEINTESSNRIICDNPDCKYLPLTVTMVAPAHTVEYDGNNANATYTVTKNGVTLTNATEIANAFVDAGLDPSELYFRYFTADITLLPQAPTTAGSYYALLAYKNNQIVQIDYTIAAHQHDWEYSELSNLLNVRCKKADKCGDSGHSLYFDPSGTIEQWDGSDRTATLNFSESNSADTFGAYTKTQLLDMLRYYRRNDDNTKTPIDSIPDEAGAYRVELTVDGNTIYIELAIDPHSCTWDYSFPGGTTATAWCKSTNCPHNTSRDTLTLYKPSLEMEYEGALATAYLEADGGDSVRKFGAFDVYSDFTIRYYNAADTAFENPLSAAPTVTGSYVVRATLNSDPSKYLTDSYSITPHVHILKQEQVNQNTVNILCTYGDCPNLEDPILTLTLNAPAHKEVYDGKNPAATWTGFPEGKSWSDYGITEPTVNYFHTTLSTSTYNAQDTKDVVGSYEISTRLDVGHLGEGFSLTVYNTIAEHQHDWEITASGNTFTAVCKNTSCPYHTASVTATLNKPVKDRVCSTESAAAYVTVSGMELFADTSSEELNRLVEYSSNGITWSNVQPTAAGTYTARIVHSTWGTISVSYTIADHDWAFDWHSNADFDRYCKEEICQYHTKLHVALVGPDHAEQYDGKTVNVTKSITMPDGYQLSDYAIELEDLRYYSVADDGTETPVTLAQIQDTPGKYIVRMNVKRGWMQGDAYKRFEIAPHTHDWEYSESANTLSALCKKHDKCGDSGHYLNLDPFDRIEQWDGSDRTVTLNFSYSNSADTFGAYTKTQLLGMLQYYRLNDDNTTIPLDSIPDEEGFYRVELTVDGNTIKNELVIAPHRCTWDYSFPGGETATAWCTNTNCPHNTNRNTLTLTMYALPMEHGTGRNYATLSSTGEYGELGDYLSYDFTITYYTADDTARENPMTDAPTAAGTYVAVATANDNAARTLSKTYTIAPHTHSWIYEAQDNKITAKCYYHTESTCPQEPITMTLIAPAHVKEGDNLAPEITWTVSDNTQKLGGVYISSGVIKYYSVVNDVATELTAAPTQAGTYYATYTVTTEQGDVSATVVYTINSRFSQEEIAWLIAWLNSRRFDLTASAGEGGSITPAGKTEVKYGASQTYTITPDEGYEIASVVVDGKPVGKLSGYTFKNVAADHTITVTFAKKTWANPFTDVDPTNPYYDAIRYVVEKGLMNGMSETEFVPTGKLTRAQIVTILWRMAGQPKAESANFTDVDDGMWYTDAINWAAEQGLVLGFGDGTFKPDETLTNAQLAVIMYRYAQKLGEGFTGAWAYRMDYADLEDVPDWAFEAISWMTMKNIYTTDSDGNLDANGDVTRAKAAAFLYNFGLFFEAKK